MCMKDRMKQFLVDVLNIHDKDLVEMIIGISSIKHCTKGQTLYIQGERVDTCGFLMNGVTGAFIYTKSGKQIADDFSFLAGEIITPLTNKQKKALTSVTALTKVDVFMISNVNMELLFKANVRYQMAAKERYLFFLEKYRGLDEVVSDKYLASFLDMSPETLSRQKRSLREKKPE